MSVDLTNARHPGPPPEANLGYLFRLAYQQFRSLLDRELEDTGLSAQEYAILSVFETRTELSISELARISQVTRQTMHAAIVRLESARLLERSAQNQRVILLRPTKQGREVLRVATAHIRAAERAAFAGLTDGDEATVRVWLSRLAGMPLRSLDGEGERKDKS